MTLEDKRVKSVSFKLNVDEAAVRTCVRLLLERAKEGIESCQVDKLNIMPENEFKLNTNIIKIPYLGLLVPSYKAYTYMTARKKTNKNQKK